MGTMGLAAGLDRSTTDRDAPATPMTAKEAELAELEELQDAGIGVIICCGRRLKWRREKGSAVYEAECENCGNSYAMDRGYDYYEDDEKDPDESYGRFSGRAS